MTSKYNQHNDGTSWNKKTKPEFNTNGSIVIKGSVQALMIIQLHCSLGKRQMRII